jgi:FkbM family methyltransferase
VAVSASSTVCQWYNIALARNRVGSLNHRPMTEHHPVFLEFSRFKGEVPAGYDHDFLGSKIRTWFWGGPSRDTPLEVDTPYPPFDEEYFEWIDLLESVVAARDSYNMVELGAGYGRWALRAAQAVRQYSSIPFHLTAVEADPVHFDWISMHFEDNGVDPSQHTLLHAAVGGASGNATLVIGSHNDSHTPQGRMPQWYGQWLIEGAPWDMPARAKARTKGVEEPSYGGHQVYQHRDGRKSISVPQVSMQDVLKDIERVDLIDLDVQGQELNAISRGMDELNGKVKRLHIGTHAPEIEAGLRTLLGRNGWQCLADYPRRGTRETPFGMIDFDDGVQSWINPRIE